MRKEILLTMLIIVLGVATAAVWTPEPLETNEATALTAHAMQIAYGPGGVVKSSVLASMAFRSDGAYAIRQTIVDHVDHKVFVEREVYDTEIGRRTIVYPIPEAMTSFSFDPSTFNLAKCDPYTLALPEVGEFLGFRVVEFQADNDVTQDRMWHAPELNCMLVFHESKLIEADGSVGFIHRFQVTSVQLGEPDPSYFDVRDDFAEVSPSQGNRLQLEAAGLVDEAAECCGDSIQEGDEGLWSYADRTYEVNAWDQ